MNTPTTPTAPREACAAYVAAHLEHDGGSAYNLGPDAGPAWPGLTDEQAHQLRGCCGRGKRCGLATRGRDAARADDERDCQRRAVLLLSGWAGLTPGSIADAFSAGYKAGFGTMASY